MTRRVVGCMYLDNQARLGYPIKAVVDSVNFVDDWLFAASDEDNLLYLHPLGRTVMTGVHITEPNDISRAMNAALDQVFYHTKADVVVLVQADTMSTPEVDAFVRNFAQHMPLNAVRWLVARDAHLYYHFQPGWGYSIVGRDCRDRFTGDGGALTGEFIEKAPTCLHVGFLGSALAFRHARSNARLWGTPEHAAEVEAYDLEAFIRWYVPHIKKHSGPKLQPIAETGPYFEDAIDRLGLRDDQEFVYDFVKREGL